MGAITSLGFGTMQFGGRADAAASARMFQTCREAGIRHFDTAHVYTDGEAERILGRLVREDGAAGAGIEIATKIGYSGGAGAANLAQQFAQSQARLDCPIDLLYLHRFDPGTPLEESLALLARWQADGLIKRIGLSNFPAWAVMKAEAIARSLGTRIAAIQPMYSLIKRQAEVELLPMALDQGMMAYSYSPLGGGLLTGKYAKGGTGRLSEDARYGARYGQALMETAARSLAGLAAEWGLDPASLAVAFVLHHPARPIPLVSGRHSGQLAPALAGATIALTPQMYHRLAGLYPAPPPATDRTEET